MSCVGSDDARAATSTQGERSVRGAQASHLSQPKPAHAQGRDPSHDHRLHREPRGAAGGRLRQQWNAEQTEMRLARGRDVTERLCGDVIDPAHRPLRCQQIQGRFELFQLQTLTRTIMVCGLRI